MVGILKNPLPKENVPVIDESENVAEFRKQVFKNTQLNAKLTKGQASAVYNELASRENNKASHTFVPRDSLSLKHEHDVPTLEEELNIEKADQANLQWNKSNLEENEIKKLQYQNIHVDEPKTPYQGAVDPTGEYYKPDDEDEGELQEAGTQNGSSGRTNGSLNELDDFSLGEPEYKIEPINDDGRIETDPSKTTSDDEEDQEEAKAAKHRRFEEMRKKHYNVREIFKNKHQFDHDEDEDKEDQPQA